MKGINGRLACPFCNRHYSRRDALKRHCLGCPSRNGRPIDISDCRKGRIRHACDQCSSRKLFCDGRSRCSSCVAKEVRCTRNHIGGVGYSISMDDHDSLWRKQRKDLFLLSDSYQEVMSKFNFPRPVEEEAMITSIAGRMESLDNLAPPSSSIIDASLGIDFDFLDSMFGWDLSPPTPEDLEMMTGEHDLYICGLVENPGKLSRIKGKIMNRPEVHTLDEHVKTDIERKLMRILTTNQTSACLTGYFRYWHRNCRMIHEPTFSAGATPDCLLAAMVFLGAAYSPSSDIRGLTRDVIDHVESYVFAQGDLAFKDCFKPSSNYRLDFEILQSMFLIVIIQFWTGDEISRRRAMTTRFSSVVQASRLLGLLSVKRTFEDQSSERTWILKESQIRTVAYIILLDCGLLFFRGIPLRILSSEIDCALPCEEELFDTHHPFKSSRFAVDPPLDTRSAFSLIFGSAIEMPESLTLLDTFILIHLLYRFVNDVLTLRVCLNNETNISSPENALITSALYALDRWHHLWDGLREEAKQQGQWDELGFFKNGDQYEAATRLLLSDEARPVIGELLAADTDRLALLQAFSNRRAIN